jgi:hypothetical protein
MGLLKTAIMFIPNLVVSIVPPPLNVVVRECINLAGNILI